MYHFSSRSRETGVSENSLAHRITRENTHNKPARRLNGRLAASPMRTTTRAVGCEMTCRRSGFSLRREREPGIDPRARRRLLQVSAHALNQIGSPRSPFAIHAVQCGVDGELAQSAITFELRLPEELVGGRFLREVGVLRGVMQDIGRFPAAE